MIAGRDAASFGEGKNSWLTGTAAWTFLSISQAILGLKPTLDGLMVDPCLPAEMKGFEVTRRYRGAVYHITVKNPDGKQHGVKQVLVDGTEQKSKVLAPAPAGSSVKVEIVMG